jgi:hypothetical protein
MRDSVLYFPSIRFQSERWLKASLLVWDKVYRIVPTDYRPDDGDEVLVAEGEGMVRSLAPEQADLTAAAARFERFWENLRTMPAGFSPHGPRETVHVDKIDSRLYPILEEAAGAVSGSSVTLPRELARAYMLILAEEMARRRNLILATDNPDAWVMEAYVHHEGDFSDFVFDTGAQYQYCHISFSQLLPLDVADLPMKRISEIARTSGELRKEFRDVAAGFVERLTQCESEAHAVQLASDFRNRLTDSMETVRRHLLPFNRSGLTSLLTLGAPIAAFALPALVPGIEGATRIVLPGLIAVGLVAALSDYYRPRPHTDAVGAYLLDVDRSRSHRGAIPDLRATMEEFIND